MTTAKVAAVERIPRCCEVDRFCYCGARITSRCTDGDKVLRCPGCGRLFAVGSNPAGLPEFGTLPREKW